MKPFAKLTIGFAMLMGNEQPGQAIYFQERYRPHIDLRAS